MQTKQYVHRTLLFIVPLSLSLVLTVTPVRPVAAQGGYTCPGNPPPRLVIGGVAVVTPGSPSNLRDEPSLSAPVLAKLPPGAQIYVVSGPSCAEGFTWWGVTPEFNSLPQDGSWTDGWIAEGQGATYFVQPLAAPLTTTTSTFTIPTDASSMTVSTDGVSFLYDGFAGQSVQVQHSLDDWGRDGGWPGWVESYEFSFLPHQPTEAHIIVVKNGAQLFGKPVMADFAKRFKAKATLPADKPINYIHYNTPGFKTVQLFHAQESYLAFPNFLGLRFVSDNVWADALLTGGTMLNGKVLTYEFIGVSGDDSAYIWAEFVVSTNLLADNHLPSNFNSKDDPHYYDPQPDPIYKAYVTQTVAKLQKGTAQDFLVTASTNGQTTIADLDQMIASITVSQ